MTTDIKPGYMLKITTWENDADNYNTKTLTGLSKEDTILNIKIANLFNTCHGSGDTLFGNADMYRPWDQPDFPIEGPYPDRSDERYRRDDDLYLSLRVKEVIDAHKEQFGAVPEYWDYTHPKYNNPTSYKQFRDFVGGRCYDLIGNWADGEYWRVFESFDVFLIPDVIKNVTEEFK